MYKGSYINHVIFFIEILSLIAKFHETIFKHTYKVNIEKY